MKTCCYRIKGIVQGIGFRPFIHKVASKYELKGWVLNDLDGVVVEVQGKQKDIDSFVDELLDKNNRRYNYPFIDMHIWQRKK